MYHLALSKNKKFWSSSLQNIYLGPWTTPDFLKENFSEYNIELIDWHWDNLDKFYSDTSKIVDSYDKFIVKLAKVLNELHGLNWSLKAWKILCGPWLRRYLTILYERNESVSKIYYKYNIKSCTLSNASLINLQVKDFENFSERYKYEDYNNIIYSHILKKLDIKKKINFKELNFQSENTEIKQKKDISYFLKYYLKKIFFSKHLNVILSFFFKKNDYYLQTVYLKNKFEEIKLHLKLKNFPYVKSINSRIQDKERFNEKLRKEFHEKVKKTFDVNENNFYEKLVVDLIYYMFPRCYLENFINNSDYSQKIFNHHNPKIIIDSASYQKDELFKFWVAKKTQNDCKFIILQHGGYYENFKFKPDLIDHELEVADKYLSWGWKKKTHNVEPIACSIPFKKENIKKSDNIVNIILRTVGCYANNLSTHDIPYKNAEAYLESVINISNLINKDKKLRIFLHPGENPNEERGFHIKPYLEKKILNKNIEFFNGKINKYINYTDLNIFTYLGTPYNQTISADIPCLVFNNEKYEPLNQKYRLLYDSMIKNKLMHTNYFSLANHISNNEYKISDWWIKKETIESKNFFCKNFARKNYDLEELLRAIKD